MRWILVVLLLVQPALAQRYLSAEEASVVTELNLLRTQPQQYRALLEADRGAYQGLLYVRRGATPIRTKEGLAAVDEAIEALRDQPPLEPVEASLALTLAARDHVRDQGPRGVTGHDGSDGSRPVERVNRYGVGSFVGENIAYGYSTGRDIVMQLLIDDGVPSRGHRTNLLNPRYRQVGVAIGPHASFKSMCVMDLGAEVENRTGLKASVPASPTSPDRSPPPSGGPFEQARTVALAHYQALLNDDRAAWMQTWAASQRGTLGQRWFAAKSTAGGQEYRYAGTQRVSPSRMTLVFLRGKTVRCPITLVLEGGVWKVEEANY